MPGCFVVQTPLCLKFIPSVFFEFHELAISNLLSAFFGGGLRALELKVSKYLLSRGLSSSLLTTEEVSTDSLLLPLRLASFCFSLSLIESFSSLISLPVCETRDECLEEE